MVQLNGERLSATMRRRISSQYDLQLLLPINPDKLHSHSIANRFSPHINIVVEKRNDQVGDRNSSNRLNTTLTPSSKSRNTAVTNSEKALRSSMYTPLPVPMPEQPLRHERLCCVRKLRISSS